MMILLTIKKIGVPGEKGEFYVVGRKIGGFQNGIHFAPIPLSGSGR
jgi:Na+(H+)/acetate symporter ActP